MKELEFYTDERGVLNKKMDGKNYVIDVNSCDDVRLICDDIKNDMPSTWDYLLHKYKSIANTPLKEYRIARRFVACRHGACDNIPDYQGGFLAQEYVPCPLRGYDCEGATFLCLGSPSLGLTSRQKQIMYWLNTGRTEADVAEIMYITTIAVKKIKKAVYDQLGVYSISEFQFLAHRKGLFRNYSPDRPESCFKQCLINI